MKHLEINLTKNVQNQYTENCKMLWKAKEGPDKIETCHVYGSEDSVSLNISLLLIFFPHLLVQCNPKIPAGLIM